VRNVFAISVNCHTVPFFLKQIQQSKKEFSDTLLGTDFNRERKLKADPFQIGDVLKNPKRFIVPIYQRTYAWEIKPHLETFFDQVEAKAKERLKGDGKFPHYMGAVLVIPRGAYSFGRMEVLDVVDGQQRLATFQIFLAALRDLARTFGQSQTADLLGSLLLNPEGPQLHERIERYKLYPTAYDRKLYCDLVDLDRDGLYKKYPNAFYKNGNVLESADLLLRAWGYLRREAEAFICTLDEGTQAARLSALSAALLEDFQVIVITLGEYDDAQVIFETLNAGGKPLAAMDLVRNDVFHRAVRAGENVELLMENRWRTFEEPFWKEFGIRGRIKKPRIDFFLSDTLAAETGKEILLTELYARYKSFVVDRKFPTVDSELETLLKHAPTFRKLVEPTGQSALAELGRELAVLDVTTAYPLVFVIEASNALEAEKEALYELIVSYVVRRMICGLTAKNYNNVFLRLAGQLRTAGVSLATGASAFGALDGDTVRFPNNTEFRNAISSRRQYGNIQQQRLRHILGRLECEARDKFDEANGLADDLTIEHVLPDAWTEHWPLPDGTQAAADLMTRMSESQLKLIAEREGLKHTLGNLTLLTDSRNPSLGNLDFTTKQVQLTRSLLKLNHEIAEVPDWTEERIRTRASRLSDLAIKVWPALDLSVVAKDQNPV
jgi:Protein of unknown function DUF262/Protein of unknown function (DUF1524)